MTIIELMITLVVMVIAVYFISPAIFHLPEPIILNNEIDQVRSFIYRIQSKARYQKKDFTISISQNSENRWCIIAIAKNNNEHTACDCLNIKSCRISDEYFLYQSNLQYIKLKTKDLYPHIFIRMSGKSGRLESKCLGFGLHQYSLELQFNQNGVINVADKSKRTQCR